MSAPVEAGEEFTHARTFTEADVAAFADVSEDRQDRHTDRDPPMVQGLLTATLATKIGSDLSVLARSMTFTFRAPVYAGDHVECTWTTESVTERDDRWDLTASIRCRTDDGQEVLVGEVDGVIPKE